MIVERMELGFQSLGAVGRIEHFIGVTWGFGKLNGA